MSEGYENDTKAAHERIRSAKKSGCIAIVCIAILCFSKVLPIPRPFVHEKAGVVRARDCLANSSLDGSTA